MVKIKVGPICQLFSFTLMHLFGLGILTIVFVVIQPNELIRQRDQYDSRSNFFRQRSDFIGQELHTANQRTVVRVIGYFA